ncbi:hypothetical protein E2C01_068439 [Portunus trituberculatus]|uniref:Uncharacterized protein n=1 Tax=Portunus trituberculatus TaxID=210409 RepID=A0A5B7HVT9_PORTR|nr:hypothetical protein [Portunus trituberculatus]
MICLTRPANLGKMVLPPPVPHNAGPATHASAASRQSCIFFVLSPELRLTCLHSLLLNLDSITTSQIVPHSSVYFSLPAAILIMLKFPARLNFLLFLALFLFTHSVCRRDNFGTLSSARASQKCLPFMVTQLDWPPALLHLPLILLTSQRIHFSPFSSRSYCLHYPLSSYPPTGSSSFFPCPYRLLFSLQPSPRQSNTATLHPIQQLHQCHSRPMLTTTN